MRIYTGIDILEISRMKEKMEKNENLKYKVFTEKEIEISENRKKQKYEAYSGKYSAKEAIYKALSFLRKETYFSFLDFEIVSNDMERPRVNFLREDLKKLVEKYNIQIDFSITHEKEYSVANAVALVLGEKE